MIRHLFPSGFLAYFLPLAFLLTCVVLSGCIPLSKDQSTEHAPKESVTPIVSEQTTQETPAPTTTDEPYEPFDITLIPTEPVVLAEGELPFELVRIPGTEDVPTVSEIRLADANDRKRFEDLVTPLDGAFRGELLSDTDLKLLDEEGIEYELIYTKRKDDGFLLATADNNSELKYLPDYYDPTLHEMVEPPQVRMPEISPDTKGLYMIVKNKDNYPENSEEATQVYNAISEELYAKYDLLVLRAFWGVSSPAPFSVIAWGTLQDIKKALEDGAIVWGGQVRWADKMVLHLSGNKLSRLQPGLGTPILADTETAVVFIPRKENAQKVRNELEDFLKTLSSHTELTAFITDWHLKEEGEDGWITAEFTVNDLHRKQLFNFIKYPLLLQVNLACRKQCYF